MPQMRQRENQILGCVRKIPEGSLLSLTRQLISSAQRRKQALPAVCILRMERGVYVHVLLCCRKWQPFLLYREQILKKEILL